MSNVNVLTTTELKDMFIYVSDQILASKELLTEVDSAIGDGDHGIGMSVGFKKAKENLQAKDFADVNELFKTIGMSLISTMGGASGVIFGTVFVGGIKSLDKHETLDTAVLAEIFAGSLQGVKDRGKASVGDKTMVDALEPAVISLRESADKNRDLVETLTLATEAANDGVEKSKDYVAKFGRAKSLGERAVGHQDAGATSVWIIFKSMLEWVEANK